LKKRSHESLAAVIFSLVTQPLATPEEGIKFFCSGVLQFCQCRIKIPQDITLVADTFSGTVA